MRDHDISQRPVAGRRLRTNAEKGAGRIVSVDSKTVRRDRPSRRAAGECNIRQEGDNADVREVMREITGKRRPFGYRRIGLLLERKGHVMNHKKLYRIYREEGLAVNFTSQG